MIDSTNSIRRLLREVDELKKQWYGKDYEKYSDEVMIAVALDHYKKFIEGEMKK